MATLQAAACAAHASQHPTAFSRLLVTGRVVDAIDDLEGRLLALEAIEQLMHLDKAGSAEDLAHVDRQSLAWLLTIVSADLRTQLAVARQSASDAHSIQQQFGAQP